MCPLDECAVSRGAPLECLACTEQLDGLDREPAPARPAMAVDVLVRVVARGTRAALGQRARDAEKCLSVLEQHLAGVAPIDGTRQDADTWARLGAVAGARDTWTANPSRLPKDCPAGEAAAAYVIAYQGAAMIVAQIRQELGQ